MYHGKPCKHHPKLAGLRYKSNYGCHACIRVHWRRWKEKYPEKRLAQKRRDNNRNNRKRKYNVTHEEFTALFKGQGERCAICRTAEPSGNGWCLDHDHALGNVRGVLCFKCNTGLGLFKDDPRSLSAAIDYLKVSAAV
jgi:recombination endonuclease VII